MKDITMYPTYYINIAIIHSTLLGMITLWYISVDRDPHNFTPFLHAYTTMTNEEKGRFDLKKIKRIIKDYILLLGIYTTAMITSIVIMWEPLEIVSTALFIVWLISSYLLKYTDVFLVLFCRRDGDATNAADTSTPDVSRRATGR